MKISNITALYSSKIYTSTETKKSFPRQIGIPCDVVSFTAKKYDDESIVNPTNHCGYCGCKVYSESQIDSIAKEILLSKYDRLQGKIKSVLEKLEGAKYSEELALAKRLENKDQIQFFKNLLDAASKKPFLKGDALFQQVYQVNTDEAMKILVANLNPLLKTIDHISPQNEGKDNQHSDINLVEACRCCNHDLKKGASFIEFYTMYPSIKNNMPPEKFQYAASSLLDSQSDGVLQRLSATNMLKTIRRLFIQRAEAKTYLDSIDFRIQTSISGINSAIESARQQIEEKETELRQKEAQLDELKKDKEFQAILDRIAYAGNIEIKESVIAQMKGNIQHISNQINELRHPPKKKKNPRFSREQAGQELSPAEKQEKIESLKAQMRHIENQVLEHEIDKEELESKIKELNQMFPPAGEMQQQKRQTDSVINAYQQLAKVLRDLSDKQAELTSQQAKKNELEALLKEFPQGYAKAEDFSGDIQDEYKKYLEMENTLEYIIEHPNGGGVNTLIKQYAKASIEQEMEALEANPLVIQHKKQKEQSRLENEKSSVEKSINNLQTVISELKSTKSKLEHTVSTMSQEEAIRKSADLSERIRITNEKEQYIRLPKVIDSISAEILLLRETVSDLESKLVEIQTNFPKS